MIIQTSATNFFIVSLYHFLNVLYTIVDYTNALVHKIILA